MWHSGYHWHSTNIVSFHQGLWKPWPLCQWDRGSIYNMKVFINHILQSPKSALKVKSGVAPIYNGKGHTRPREAYRGLKSLREVWSSSQIDKCPNSHLCLCLLRTQKTTMNNFTTNEITARVKEHHG